ncbi:Gfo/Idh/MocA family protein [Terriglobus saanensis]|uniref:Oxidoreductase domain protein n=1 Tax=Terriglobus saanensis (strain ATCC BAA-1853 / DSM 23119 / SP1PR4) TaxID=401053 RepID=E8V7Z0_TERSS|nr:Gfo/Idh/MocA family oxidoreductase [Terriglobus saanensis]ADV82914.1 oxidoreductase domain protein [Terriglobus saanensis SP1PR4]
MEHHGTNRRDFLKLGSAATAVTAISWNASSYAAIPGANDRVRVGIVGCGDRMKQALIPSFQQHAKDKNFEFAAVSDIWNRRRDEGVAYVQKICGNTIATARNNEELYDRKDIDAVLIATADFQHAQHGVQAVRAGRDAYCEKPLADTIEDAHAIREAVKQTGKVFQVGTQRRSTPSYQKAYEYIRSGQFGDINMVEMTWNVNQPGRWRRPDVVPLLKEQDTDWKRYLLNKPYQAFDARKYLEFRLFSPFSSGIPDQWLVHQIDTVHWFSGYPHPRSVVANGGIYQWHDGRTNWDTLTAVFDYGPLDDLTKGFQVVYSSRQTNSAGGIKELYYSNAGMLDMDKQRVSPEGGLTARSAAEMKMQPNQLKSFALSENVAAAETSANTGADPMTSANMLNWMECVRSRKTPNASIDAGYSHSLALCMTVAAMKTGQRVTFDDKTQQLVIGGKKGA